MCKTTSAICGNQTANAFRVVQTKHITPCCNTAGPATTVLVGCGLKSSSCLHRHGQSRPLLVAHHGLAACPGPGPDVECGKSLVVSPSLSRPGSQAHPCEVGLASPLCIGCVQRIVGCRWPSWLVIGETEGRIKGRRRAWLLVFSSGSYMRCGRGEGRRKGAIGKLFRHLNHQEGPRHEDKCIPVEIPSSLYWLTGQPVPRRLFAASLD